MREAIRTDKATAPIGPFSQAIRIDGLVFVSGQVASHPETGALVGTTVAEQTEQTLRNVAAILEAAGSSLGRVVKASVFLTDMNDFAGMNEVYAKYFSIDPPARTTVQVVKLPAPGAVVEIDVVALV